MNLKARWDIYMNGTSGAKELTIAMLTSWRHLFPACGAFAEALVGFFSAVARVALVIVLPLLFWVAPVISIFTAHRVVSDDEIRARLRRNMHRNGSEATAPK